MKTMKQLSVGQVLFIIPKSSTKVIPIQVIEEITKKTIKGEEKSYIVQASKGEKAKTYNINDVAGEIFESSSVVKEQLTMRAIKQISDMIAEAERKATAWYGTSTGAEDDDDDILLQRAAPRPVPAPREVSELAQPGDEPEGNAIDSAEDGVMGVVLPDGTRAKVKLPGAADVKSA